jgi:iron complex transport system permease protein
MNYPIERALIAFFSGGLLSLSGSLMQLTFSQELATPSTLGLEALAVFVILLAHTLTYFFGGVEWVGFLSLGLGLIISFSFLYSPLGKRIGRFKTKSSLLILGLTVNLFVGAIFSIWQFLFLSFNWDFPSELWFGHFRYIDSKAVVPFILMSVGLCVVLWRKSSSFGLYSLGPEVLRHFQKDSWSISRSMIALSTTATLLVVTQFGVFSFVGLIFPILARRLCGRSWTMRREFVTSFFLSAPMMLFLDFLVYEYPIWGAEVPVGMMSLFIGTWMLIVLVGKDLWNSTNPSWQR